MDTMRERFVGVTSELLDEDPRLALVLAEITMDGFRPAQARHPERVINVGIREQLLIGTGGGLALTGMRPIMHTFASFLVERPFEQIKLDFGHQGTGVGDAGGQLRIGLGVAGGETVRVGFIGQALPDDLGTDVDVAGRRDVDGQAEPVEQLRA